MICDELKKPNMEEAGHKEYMLKDAASGMTANQVGDVGAEDKDEVLNTAKVNVKKTLNKTRVDHELVLNSNTVDEEKDLNMLALDEEKVQSSTPVHKEKALNKVNIDKEEVLSSSKVDEERELSNTTVDQKNATAIEEEIKVIIMIK